jgi:hypothetical protein
LELGAWSLELGAWSLELGAWSLELGAWSLELGAPGLLTAFIAQQPDSIAVIVNGLAGTVQSGFIAKNALPFIVRNALPSIYP